METVPPADEPIDDRQFRDWLGFTVFATVVSAALVLANPTEGFARALAAAALIVVLAPFYWFVGRPSLAGIRENSVRAWLYVVGATIVYLAALGLSDWANVALFILSPQFFLLLKPIAAGAAIVVLNGVGLVVRLVVGELHIGDIAQASAIAIFIILASIYFSNRITTVTRESAARGRLIRQLREQQAEIVTLSEQQGAAVERERIAREMHDTLAQGFTSIITLGHAVEAELDADSDAARRHIALMTETARENLQESRRIIAALTPGRLAEASLSQAVERVSQRFSDETSIPVHVTIDGDVRPAPATTEVVALRVTQESLANAGKHSAARSVAVSLTFGDSELVVAVGDDGVGFDTDAPREGYGLRGMASRVREVGGEFELTSVLGAGTNIRVTLPLKADS